MCSLDFSKVLRLKSVPSEAQVALHYTIQPPTKQNTSVREIFCVKRFDYLLYKISKTNGTERNKPQRIGPRTNAFETNEPHRINALRNEVLHTIFEITTPFCLKISALQLIDLNIDCDIKMIMLLACFLTTNGLQADRYQNNVWLGKMFLIYWVGNDCSTRQTVSEKRVMSNLAPYTCSRHVLHTHVDKSA